MYLYNAKSHSYYNMAKQGTQKSQRCFLQQFSTVKKNALCYDFRERGCKSSWMPLLVYLLLLSLWVIPAHTISPRPINFPEIMVGWIKSFLHEHYLVHSIITYGEAGLIREHDFALLFLIALKMLLTSTKIYPTLVYAKWNACNEIPCI